MNPWFLLFAGCAPDPLAVSVDAVPKAPAGEYCDGEDNDGDGVVDEGCGACDMLYTRVRSWWRESRCVIEGEGTGLRLVPLRVGSTNSYATADTLLAFLGSPGNTDKQRLGQQIAVGRLNSRAFGIGGIPYHDVDGDGDLETVDELLARADQVFDAPDTAAQASMFALLGALNAEGSALPVYIDQNCARDAEYCDGLDNDGDGSVDEGCGCVEVCDGVDNDADGLVDESGPDNDVDGYQCDDCDDTRSRTHPGAYDVPENAIDEDCDGVDPHYTYDFDRDIQPIFDASCAACHAGPSPEAGLDLSPGAYERIVGVPSTQAPTYDLVEPASPSQSYLYRKVAGTHAALGGSGGRMPLGGPYLSLAQAGVLGTWITEGAPPSCPDADGDGWDCTDCDDGDPSIYPGAPEVRGDETDQDCDGTDLLYTYGLEQDIQPLYDAYCTSCHGATTAALGLRLDAGFSWAQTVGVPASQLPTMDRIEPGDHTQSYMYHKLAGTHTSVGGGGTRMPRGGAAWLPELLEVYALWIDEGAPAEACPDADGDVASCSDCDDGDPGVRPGAVELCDGVDNDCDGRVDDPAVDAGTWFADADGDGFGDAAAAVVACAAPEGYVAIDGDCDDLDDAAFPGAAEACDGLDNDCDGAVDEGWSTVWYQDADGDRYGAAATSTTACVAPAGYVADATDCDDSRGTTYPGATEVCTSTASSCTAEGRDNDCDGVVDDGCGTLRSGTISSSTTWSGTNLICNDVTVSSAGWLTITDGAVVRVRSAKKLSVQGQLDVLGTDAAGDSYVTFEPESPSAGPGGWARIETSGASARVDITGARIDRPQYGVYSTGGGSVTITDSVVVDASLTGLYQSSGALIAERSVVGAATTGVYGSGAVVDLADLYVEAGTSAGVWTSGSASAVTVVGLVVAAPDGAVSGPGILVGGGTFTGSDVVVDGVGDDGLRASSATVTLTDAAITAPAGEGVYCSGSTTSCTLTRVDITGAGTDGVNHAGGTLAITDCTVADSADDGVDVTGDYAFTLSGTTITGAGSYPLELAYAMTLEGLDATNTLTGNVHDAVLVDTSGAVTRSTTWLDPGVPVLTETGATYEVLVNGGTELTLGAGFTLDLGGDEELRVGSSSTSVGSLVLLSTAAEPVEVRNGDLTLAYPSGPVTLADLTLTGDGRYGLRVSSSVAQPVTVSRLEVVDYDGTNAVNAAAAAATVTLSDVAVTDSTLSGDLLYLQYGAFTVSDVTVERTVATGVSPAGIYTSGSVTSATFTNVAIRELQCSSGGECYGLDIGDAATLTSVSVDGAAGYGVMLGGGEVAVDGLTVTGTVATSALPGSGVYLDRGTTLTSCAGLELTGNAGYPVVAYSPDEAQNLDLAGTYGGNGSDVVWLEYGSAASSAPTIVLYDVGVAYVTSDGVDVADTLVLDGAHIVTAGVTLGYAGSGSPNSLTCDSCVIEAYYPGSYEGVHVGAYTDNSFTMSGGEVVGFNDGVWIDWSASATPSVWMSGYMIHDHDRYGLYCTSGCDNYEAAVGRTITGGTYYDNGTDVYWTY